MRFCKEFLSSFGRVCIAVVCCVVFETSFATLDYEQKKVFGAFFQYQKQVVSSNGGYLPNLEDIMFQINLLGDVENFDSAGYKVMWMLGIAAGVCESSGDHIFWRRNEVSFPICSWRLHSLGMELLKKWPVPNNGDISAVPADFVRKGRLIALRFLILLEDIWRNVFGKVNEVEVIIDDKSTKISYSMVSSYSDRCCKILFSKLGIDPCGSCGSFTRSRETSPSTFDSCTNVSFNSSDRHLFVSGNRIGSSYPGVSGCSRPLSSSPRSRKRFGSVAGSCDIESACRGTRGHNCRETSALSRRVKMLLSDGLSAIESKRSTPCGSQIGSDFLDHSQSSSSDAELVTSLSCGFGLLADIFDSDDNDN